MRIFYVLSILLLLFSGCGKKAVTNVPTYPLPAELGDIDISYIPYEYAEDGCWVRAPYLSMELALANIPSAGINVQTCDGGFGLEGPEGVEWRHHVTVVIRYGGEMRVIDPMLADRLLSKEEWLAAIHAEKDAKVSINPAAYPVAGTDLECGSYTGEEKNLVDSVDKMTPFMLANVMIQCSYMRDYLHQSGKDTARREEQLIARTREIVLQLNEIGLIDSMGDEDIIEKIKQGPYCPEAISGPY